MDRCKRFTDIAREKENEVRVYINYVYRIKVFYFQTSSSINFFLYFIEIVYFLYKRIGARTDLELMRVNNLWLNILLTESFVCLR